MRYHDIAKKLSDTVIADIPGASTIHQIINNFLTWNYQSTTKEEWIEYNGMRIYADTSDYVARSLVIQGEYEPEISELINNYLEEGDFAIDIGGHIGHHTVTMRQLVGAEGTVWVFEPNPKNVAYIKETLSEHKWNNVELFPIALSNTESSEDLLITNSGNTGGASLKSVNSREMDEEEIKQKYTIETKKLTSILNQKGVSSVDLIKIDVEGGEADIIAELRGYTDNIETIILEFHPDELNQEDAQEMLSILNDNGDLIDINNNPIHVGQVKKEKMYVVWESN